MAETFSFTVSVVSECQVGHRTDPRQVTSYTLDLVNHDRTFYAALQSSLLRTDEVRAWCPQCRQMVTIRTRRIPTKLPRTLVVACGVRDPADMVQWRRTDTSGAGTWLPAAVSIALQDDTVTVRGARDVASEGGELYRVCAVVSHVADSSTGHAVVHVDGTLAVGVGVMVR